MDGAFIILCLGVGIGCAFASGSIAGKKGYSSTLFGVLGFCFGIIVLIVAAVLPDKNVEAASKNASAAEALAGYKRLLDDGVITQEEFDRKKSELLG